MSNLSPSTQKNAAHAARGDFLAHTNPRTRIPQLARDVQSGRRTTQPEPALQSLRKAERCQQTASPPPQITATWGEQVPRGCWKHERQPHSPFPESTTANLRIDTLEDPRETEQAYPPPQAALLSSALRKIRLLSPRAAPWE